MKYEALQSILNNYIDDKMKEDYAINVVGIRLQYLNDLNKYYPIAIYLN